MKIFIGENLTLDQISECLSLNDEDGFPNSILFEVAHELLAESVSDRAEVHEVEVTNISADSIYPNHLQIQFTTQWSLYVGCRDMNAADEEHMDEAAVYEDGYLVFTVPTYDRPTNDC